MKKKKILFMIQIPPPVHGAALRNLSLYESKLLHDNFNIRLAPLAFADSIYSIGKFSLKKLFKSFQYAFKLIGTLFSFKPDVAYFTITPSGGAFFRDCLFAFILKIFRVRIIYHLRGLGVKQGFQKNIFSKLFYRFAFRNTHVICLGAVQIDDIKGLPYKKYYIVPNGIKTEIDPLSEPTNKNGKPHLLFLSNFIKTKGVFEFLEALKGLKQQRLNFEALFVGEDYDITAEKIKEQVEKYGLSDNVKVLGPLYRSEKFKAILECDIFVLPTYFELFPGVVLEAMQCGKAIITTRTGAIPEIIDTGVNGILVEPGNIEQLTEKIKYLIEHPGQVRTFGKKAKEKFNNQYTLNIFEERMRSVFNEI
jgi:glycosyltransferase involved in cell wall biosynthesis